MKQLPWSSERLAVSLQSIPRSVQSLVFIGGVDPALLSEIEALMPQCERVVCQTFETFEKECLQNKSRRFDCAVLLGQANDPGKLKDRLHLISSVLQPTGILLFEITNPFYFKNLKLTGKVRKENLQNLTSKVRSLSSSVLKTVNEADLHFDRFRRNTPTDKLFDTWQAKHKLSTPEMQDLWTSLKPVVGAQSFLYRATMTKMPRIQIQAHVLKPIGGVNDVRIVEPLEALSTLPGVEASVSQNSKISQGVPGTGKIFILHRQILGLERSIHDIRKLRNAGYVIVAEFDDHHAPWPSIEENKFLTFAGAHAVQTTTPDLAELLREHNPEIGVFPNQLRHMPVRDLSTPSPVTTIFFGALNRKDDWGPIMDGLNRSLRTVKNPYRFDVVLDREFFDALETENKSFTPQCPYAVYKSRLHQADISLMPLQDTVFNRMKSDLKLVESAGHGVIPIASDVVYGKTDPGSSFSVICHRNEQYGEEVARLIDNPDQRLQLQQKAQGYVRSCRLLSHHVQGRYDWYQQLIKDRDNLDRGLVERLRQIMDDRLIPEV